VLFAIDCCCRFPITVSIRLTLNRFGHRCSRCSVSRRRAELPEAPCAELVICRDETVLTVVDRHDLERMPLGLFSSLGPCLGGVAALGDVIQSGQRGRDVFDER
jgi:hypothetical protein